jgi:AraC family transcriptional regulator
MSASKARTGYETRLNRVIDYIYGHLEADIRFDDLAEVACLSPYHWHRVYAAMRGETITATIRRLRLSRAAERLANSDMALDVIAERAGYGSANAFGRAFKEAYGKSPTDYRATGSHAAFKAAWLAEDGEAFPSPLRRSLRSAAPALPIRAPICRSTMRWGGCSPRLQPKRSWQRIGRCWRSSMTTPTLCRSTNCIRALVCRWPTASRWPRRLRRRSCAVVSMRGCVTRALMPRARWLLGIWLPQSGHEPDDAPVFEVYLNSPQQVPPTALTTDIHLPLRAP